MDFLPKHPSLKENRNPACLCLFGYPHLNMATSPRPVWGAFHRASRSGWQQQPCPPGGWHKNLFIPERIERGLREASGSLTAVKWLLSAHRRTVSAQRLCCQQHARRGRCVGQHQVDDRLGYLDRSRWEAPEEEPALPLKPKQHRKSDGGRQSLRTALKSGPPHSHPPSASTAVQGDTPVLAGN